MTPWFYTGAYEISCNSINLCIWSDLFNFWQKYFSDFLKSLTYMVYDKAIDTDVLSAIVVVIALILFLGFIVGLIFMRR